MEPEKTVYDGKRVLRIGRLEVGLNLFIQVLVWGLIVLMLNYWSAKHFKRFDWGRNTELQLSPMTKSLLENLEKPVRAIIYFSDENAEAERLATLLLREYEYASKGKLSIETVSPDANRTRAQELAAKYKFQDQESLIIFDCEGRPKLVPSNLLAEMKRETPQEKMARAQTGGEEPVPHMESFNGESMMTAAILEVTEPKKRKIYFLTGHGEAEFNSMIAGQGRATKLLQLTLEQFNFTCQPLNLSSVDRVPEDADAVFILGPTGDFGDRDLRMLSDYWENKGRLLVCVGPTVVRKEKLNAWLAIRGITPRGDDVIKVDYTRREIFRAWGFLGVSPIVRSLQNRISVFRTVAAQSLAVDATKSKTDQLRFSAFMAAPDGFWGETTPTTDTELPVKDPQTDNVTPPLLLGVQVEKGGSEDPKVKLETARMIVIGIGEILMDRVAEPDASSMELAVAAANVLVSRETVTGIPPKARESVNYSVPPEQINGIGFWIIFYIPLSIAIFGLYYLRWRHGKSFFLMTAWLAGIFLALVGGYYLLLRSLGDDTASTMPKGLVAALFGAALCGAGAAALHLVERKKRPLRP